MPIRENREYRSLQIERRAEEPKEKDYIVEGYASTFEPYELFKLDDGLSCCEKIEPTAFDDADLSDVIFLYNHEGMVYARMKNGTLDINIDDKGLHTRTDLSSTQGARDLYESIQKGLIDQMSFAFTVEEDEYVEDNEENKCTRIIKRIGKVYDVSAVSIPANPGTDINAISARSAFNGVIERQQAERLAKEKRIALAKARYAYLKVKGE